MRIDHLEHPHTQQRVLLQNQLRSNQSVWNLSTFRHSRHHLMFFEEQQRQRNEPKLMSHMYELSLACFVLVKIVVLPNI